jgi:pre-mRNA-processing factor 19
LVSHNPYSLSSVRRKRKLAPGYSKAADVKTYTQTSTVPSVHGTKPPGITALDLSLDGKLALTGGADKTVQVYDFDSEKTLATLKGHTKPVNKVEFVDTPQRSMIVSSSADKTVKLWSSEGAAGAESEWKLNGNMTGHKGDIVGFAVHPSKRYVAIGSADSTWSMRDLETTSVVKTYNAIEGFEGSFTYTSAAMHPDGLLYGFGTDDGRVRIWDARDDKTLAGTLDSHTSAGKSVTTLSFSENGYFLATGSKQDPSVNVFDLRKLSILSTINFNPDGKVNEVRFDPSAQFLSVVGTEAKVYANKSWEEVLTFDDNAGELTGLRWGGLGEKIVLAGMDRHLRVLSAAA